MEYQKIDVSDIDYFLNFDTFRHEGSFPDQMEFCIHVKNQVVFNLCKERFSSNTFYFAVYNEEVESWLWISSFENAEYNSLKEYIAQTAWEAVHNGYGEINEHDVNCFFMVERDVALDILEKQQPALL